MPARSLLLAALTPALLLGACAGGTQNRGLESVHQPVVARQDYVLDVRTAGDGLATGEARRLQGWLASMRLGYGDRVAVEDPSGYRGVREDVAQSVAGFGLILSEDRPIVGAPVAPGAARVVVSRTKAFVPGCPDWSRNANYNYDQHTSSNFGCATNSNLAAMIAQPEDLVHGRGSAAGTDTTRSAKAIDAFRKAAPSGGGGGTVQSAGGGK